MADMAFQTNILSARNSQLAPGPAHSKGMTGPRKALADIKNLHKGKTVSFSSANKPSTAFKQRTGNVPASANRPSTAFKSINNSNIPGSANRPSASFKSIKDSNLHGNRYIGTPAAKSLKTLNDRSHRKPLAKTPALKSAKHMKATTVPIKVYEDTDNGPVNESDSQVNSKYDLPAEKDYMPPCTDKEYEIPLPDYIYKLCQATPSFNIDLSKSREIIPNEEFVEKANTEFLENHKNLPSLPKPIDEGLLFNDYLISMLSDTSLQDDDDDLLLRMDNDDSFSLEALDRELRSAGLEIPDDL